MSYLLILLALSFAVSSLGWIYFIYFFSIGYGFAISALSVASVIIFRDVITLPIAILAAVLFIYGIRLGLFLLLREKEVRFLQAYPVSAGKHHEEAGLRYVYDMDILRTSLFGSDQSGDILPLQS